MVSHHLDVLRESCDRIVVIEHAQIQKIIAGKEEDEVRREEENSLTRSIESVINENLENAFTKQYGMRRTENIERTVKYAESFTFEATFCSYPTFRSIFEFSYSLLKIQLRLPRYSLVLLITCI